MLSVSIDRTSLGMLPLVIDDTGVGTYGLMPGWSAGSTTWENTIAESRWVSGGALTSARATVTNIDATIRVNTSDLGALVAAVDLLGAALAQFDYTVTVTEGSAVRTYACMPGTWRRAFDKNAMLHGRDYVTLSIPRQP